MDPKDGESQTTTQEPEGDEAPQTKLVELLGGVKVELPADQAAKYIAAQDERNRSYNETQAKLQAEADAKEQARQEAERAKRMAEAVELAKKGDIEEAKKKFEQETRQQLETNQRELSKLSLAMELAKRSDVVATAIDDVVSMLAGRIGYKNGKSFPVGDDGQPLTNADGTMVSTNDYLSTWLSQKPHFLRDRTPSGSGADGGAPTTPQTAQKMRRADWEKLPGKQRAEFLNNGGTLKD